MQRALTGRLKSLKLSILTASIFAACAAGAGADSVPLPIKGISVDSQKQILILFATRANAFPSPPHVLDLPGPDHRVVLDFTDAIVDKAAMPASDDLSQRIHKIFPAVKGIRYSNLVSDGKPIARVVIDLPERLPVTPRVVKLEDGAVTINLGEAAAKAKPQPEIIPSQSLNKINDTANGAEQELTLRPAMTNSDMPMPGNAVVAKTNSNWADVRQTNASDSTTMPVSAESTATNIAQNAPAPVPMPSAETAIECGEDVPGAKIKLGKETVETTTFSQPGTMLTPGAADQLKQPETKAVTVADVDGKDFADILKPHENHKGAESATPAATVADLLGAPTPAAATPKDAQNGAADDATGKSSSQAAGNASGEATGRIAGNAINKDAGNAVTPAKVAGSAAPNNNAGKRAGAASDQDMDKTAVGASDKSAGATGNTGKSTAKAAGDASDQDTDKTAAGTTDMDVDKVAGDVMDKATGRTVDKAEAQHPVGTDVSQSDRDTNSGVPKTEVGATPSTASMQLAMKLYNSAVKAHLSGKLADAILNYKGAIAANPQMAEAYSNLGLIYNQQHNYEPALVEFRKALAINPKDAITYNGIGAALRAQNDLIGAIKNWQTAVSLDPRLATAYYNLGTAYELQHDYDKAIDSYQLASRNDHHLGEAYYRLGLIMQRQHRPEEAAAEFKEVLKISTTTDYAEDAKRQLAFINAARAPKH